MADARECRRCLLEELESEQALYAAVTERVRLAAAQGSGEGNGRRVRKAGLALCRDLRPASFGGACAQCGCYVEIRAAKRRPCIARIFNPKW